MTFRTPPVSWPTPLPTITLEGHLICLEPLTEAHIPELLTVARHEEIWKYTTSQAMTERAMRLYVAGLLREHSEGSAVPFAVRKNNTNSLVGATRLKKVSREHRSALVGSWYTPSVWRTGVNVEAKLHLLSFAFEQLGLIRLEFHTDSENERSRTALLRLGATQEGILRSCQITRDGRRRDSVVFSVLDTEWAAVRRILETRLRREPPGPITPSRPEVPVPGKKTDI